MAATVTPGEGFIEITAIDADWSWLDTFLHDQAGIWIDFICFSSSSDADKISIRDGSATGPRIFPLKPILGNGEPQIVYYRSNLRPVIVLAESAFTGTESVVIKYKA